MAKATTKKASASKAKADEASDSAVPANGQLNTGVDGQPTADSAPAGSHAGSASDPEPAEPIAEADEFGQPVEQKKVDQGPDVDHPTVAPGNEQAAKPIHNPGLVEKHANEITHVVGTEQTKDHSDPSEVAAAAIADPDVPLGQDADPNGPDGLRDE